MTRNADEWRFATIKKQADENLLKDCREMHLQDLEYHICFSLARHFEILNPRL